MTVGPDQGISWLIALDCFLINFITVGIARTIGVLYVELIALYGISREAATTPFSIRVFTTNMTGPLVGFLGLKYGIRRVMTIGGLIASLGSILCSFARNIRCISIFWGIFHGIGFGLCTCLHMLTINQYFDKYRGTALGLGYSGDCFGNFAFPFIIEYLIEVYGVQGTFLIIGGILLNILPMSLLLRNPPWLKKEKWKIKTRNRNLSEDKHEEICEIIVCKNSDYMSHLHPFSNKTPNQSGNVEKESNYSKVQENIPRYVNNLGLHFHSSETDLSGITEKRDLHELDNLNLDRQPREFDFMNKNKTNYSIIKSLKDKKKNANHFNRRTKSLPSCFGRKRLFEEYTGIQKNCVESSPKNADYHYKVARVDLEEATTKEKCLEKAILGDRILRLASPNHQLSDLITAHHIDGIKTEYKRKMAKENTYKSSNCVSQEIILSVSDNMTDISNFKQSEVNESKNESNQSMMSVFFRTLIKPMFILMSISSAVYVFLLTCVLTIFVDYAADLRIPKTKGKYFIIGFSVADLVGRLVLGQVLDRNLMKIKNYVATNVFLMGVLPSIIPLNLNFYYMMTCLCLYGVVQGGTAIMFPILLNTYMDRRTHSAAMGCLNFYGGLLILLLPSTIHFFRDNMGSYDSLFYVNGGIVAFVGLVWLFEPKILKFQLRR